MYKDYEIKNRQGDRYVQIVDEKAEIRVLIINREVHEMYWRTEVVNKINKE